MQYLLLWFSHWSTFKPVSFSILFAASFIQLANKSNRFKCIFICIWSLTHNFRYHIDMASIPFYGFISNACQIRFNLHPFIYILQQIILPFLAVDILSYWIPCEIPTHWRFHVFFLLFSTRLTILRWFGMVPLCHCKVHRWM